MLMTDVAALKVDMTVLKADNEEMKADLNSFYLMWAGALIFLMQAGFATLSAGSIRAKNVKNILLKNLLDACIGAFAWFLLGFGFAYDSDGDANSFIGAGKSNFALSGDVYDASETNGSDWINWFFQFTFAAAAATIVSGAVAERCQLVAYLVYSFCITGFIYPVVVHWVWDGAGFLSAGNSNKDTVILTGVIDFAGSGVVHMTGGFAALVGAKILGSRLGRWENPSEFEGHSTPLQLIGTFLLWFGWYGFNPGSTLAVHAAASTMAHRRHHHSLRCNGWPRGPPRQASAPFVAGRHRPLRHRPHVQLSPRRARRHHRRLCDRPPVGGHPHRHHRRLRVPRRLVHDEEAPH